MPSDRTRKRRRDAVMECLSTRERRHVVRILRDRGAVTLDELAAAVADEQATRTGRLELALHHRHLPKLDDAGLVEYDPDRDMVEPTERTVAADIVARTVEQCGALAPDAKTSGSGRARLE